MKCILMMPKEGSIKVVNFMTPVAGIPVLGRGHISHILKKKYITSLKIFFSILGHGFDKLSVY